MLFCNREMEFATLMIASGMAYVSCCGCAGQVLSKVMNIGCTVNRLCMLCKGCVLRFRARQVEHHCNASAMLGSHL